MKKQLLLFALILLPLVASADPVEIDGIYYNLVTKTKQAEVTSKPNKYTGSVVIPEKVTYENVEYSVTSIGNWAFRGCSFLTSVTIPNSVTSIGDYAFHECSYVTISGGIKGLTTVNIGNSVTSIGSYAFYGCSALTSVTIPNSVTSIGNGAFGSCSGLTSVTIGNSVTSIGGNAFQSCSGLKKVIVKDIAAWCGIKFDGYESNPLYYAQHMYSDENTEITNLAIPNGVTSIGYNAFYYCFGLTSVTIPNSVTSIGSEAFYYCKNLTSVSIPNSVTSIGGGAFYGCSRLTSITIPNSVTSIGEGAFRGCFGLTSITIPNSVTGIGESVFRGCSGLTSISIPNSVTSIGNYAFEYCSGLTSVTIGSGIKYIDGSAFASCPELTDVTCYAENVPFTYTDAFKDSYIEYATLHVPASAVNAYKAADPWKNFKSVVAIGGDTPETPETPKCEKPTISYENGQLKMSCATEGVEYVTDITDADIKKHYDATISLTATYNISVYATKSGYDNSETATATLCWIDQQPKTEGITNGIANIPAQAVLIQSEGGSIKVQGVDEGTQVNVYSINGTQAGSAISQSGAATINTNLQPGSIAIVKIGQKSVKVVIK